MKLYASILLLAVGLLLLGCPGQSNNQPANSSQPSTPPAQNNTPPAQTNTFAGMRMEQLLALNVPVECSVVQKNGTVSSAYDLKVRSGNARMEGTVSDSATGITMNASAIMVGNTTYVKIDGIPNCEWIKMTQSASTEQSFTDDPATTTYDCKPGLFGDDVFTPPAAACDISGLIGAATNVTVSGTGNASGAAATCEGLSGDALSNCQTYCEPIQDASARAACISGFAP